MDDPGSGPSWDELQNFSNTYRQGTYVYSQSTYTSSASQNSDSFFGNAFNAVSNIVGSVSNTVIGSSNTQALAEAGSAILRTVQTTLGISPAPTTNSFAELPQSSSQNPNTDSTTNTDETTMDDVGTGPDWDDVANFSNTYRQGTYLSTNTNTPEPTSPYTSAQESALALAQQAGLNTSSPAIEAVVLMTLEEYGGNPQRAVEALENIQETTGADLNRAITTNIAFGQSGCGNSQCQAADQLRAITGLDATEYQSELSSQMRQIDALKNPETTPSQPTSPDRSITVTDPMVADVPTTIPAGSAGNIGAGDMSSVLFGDTSLYTTPVEFTAPRVTTNLFTNQEIGNVDIRVFDEVQVVDIPAREVEAFTLLETERVRLNPSAVSFVDEDTYESSSLSSSVFTEVQSELKAILPEVDGFYPEHQGFPVMSAGELALAGRLDLTRNGQFDLESEQQALELATRAEIPVNVRARIANGTATTEDLIEVAGIITVLVNRVVMQGISIEEHIQRRGQITSVTIPQPDTGIPLAQEIGFQPRLLDTIEGLTSGEYARELGLTNIAPDDLAYATHYYSPDGIEAWTDGERTTPDGWDVDGNLPTYTTAGGHVFGNVLNREQSGYDYQIAGADIPLDLDYDQDINVMVASLDYDAVDSYVPIPAPRPQRLDTITVEDLPAEATSDFNFGELLNDAGNYFGGLFGITPAPEEQEVALLTPANEGVVDLLDISGNTIPLDDIETLEVINPTPMDYIAGIVAPGLGITPVFTDFDSAGDIYANYDEAGVLTESTIRRVNSIEISDTCSGCFDSFNTAGLPGVVVTTITTGGSSDSTSPIAPVNGGLYGYSAAYGTRSYGHDGQDWYPEDFLEPDDRIISASLPGRVASIRLDSDGYGRYISIEILDENGNGTGEYIRYTHMTPDPDLQVGDMVNQGDQVGLIGGWGANFGDEVEALRDSANISEDEAYWRIIDKYTDENGNWTGDANNVTAPHLHFEYTTAPDGRGSQIAQDPAELFGTTVPTNVAYTRGESVNPALEAINVQTASDAPSDRSPIITGLSEAFDIAYGVVNRYTPDILKFGDVDQASEGTTVVRVSEPVPLNEELEEFLDRGERYGIDRTNETEVAAVAIILDAMAESEENPNGVRAESFEDTLKQISDFIDREDISIIIENLSTGRSGLVESRILSDLNLTRTGAIAAIEEKKRELNTPQEQVIVTSQNGESYIIGRQLFEATTGRSTEQVMETNQTITEEEGTTNPRPSGTITTDMELGQAIQSIPGRIAEFAGDVVKSITNVFTGGTGNPTSPTVSDSLVSNNSSSGDSRTQQDTDQKLTADDISKVLIHTGVDLNCPNLQGISQNGYIYTISFVGSNEIIKREGCGVGMPNIFAQAIADDLNRTGLFQTLSGSQLIPKMEFKFYKPGNN